MVEDDDSFEEVAPNTPQLLQALEDVINPPLERLCPNKSFGCEFASPLEDDMRTHIIACDRAYMQMQIDALTATLAEKESEILRLQTILEEQERIQSEANNSNNVVLPHQELYSTIAKGINIIEVESHRALEEATAALKRTKVAIKDSVAYKQSAIAFSNIKQTFGEVHDDFVTRFKEFVGSFDRSSEPQQEEVLQEEYVEQVVREPIEDNELEIALRASAETFKRENESRSMEDSELDKVLQLSLAEQQLEC
jgi:hypothetical protein